MFVDEKETDPQFIQWREQFGRNDWYVAKGIEMANTYQVKLLDTKYVFEAAEIIDIPSWIIWVAFAAIMAVGFGLEFRQKKIAGTCYRC